MKTEENRGFQGSQKRHNSMLGSESINDMKPSVGVDLFGMGILKAWQAHLTTRKRTIGNHPAPRSKKR